MKICLMAVATTVVMACASASDMIETPRYFQDMAISDRGPGFKLTHRIRKEDAKPNENYFEAHYDDRGRIIRLRTLMKPEVLVSEVAFEYSDNSDVPSKRINLPR